MPTSDVRRVAVMGMAGSGKSTFAVRLGEALDAPVFHLDAIYWKTCRPSGWEDFLAAERQLLALDRWVLDGNYSKSRGFQERLAVADASVFMSASRWTALLRVLRRYLSSHGRPSAHGNPGGLSWEFVKWVWNWNRDHPELVESLRLQLGAKPVFVVHSRRDAEKLLARARRNRRLLAPPKEFGEVAHSGFRLRTARRLRRRGVSGEHGSRVA